MERCIEQLINGDYSPLGELYGPCFSKFMVWVRRNSYDPDDAEDAFMDALLATAKNAQTGKLVSLTNGLDPYVLRIAKNLLINLDKHNNINERYSEEQYSGMDIFKGNDHETCVGREHFIALLNRCIDQLKPREQCVFRLYYFDELDYETIAHRLQYTNVHSVRNLISLTLNKIAEIMRNTGEL
jgi:RNA polymerase sigma factor (sigma-70 family)